MASKALPQRLNVEEAMAKIEEMSGTILFEKVLTSSDVSGTGRLVIPKSQAEAHFPHLEDQSGVSLELTDSEGTAHSFRFRFWSNNQSRMYLLEGTAAVQAKYRMQAGDVLVFLKLPGGGFGICGRKGTKYDVSRKPPTRRGSSQGPGDGGAKRARGKPGESLKSKRMKQKAVTQEIQSLLNYWSGYSLPMRRDGVFRAVPIAAAAQEGDRVVAQHGAWSALVVLGGELFQAFFDSHAAAAAALQAALQSAGTGAAAPGPPAAAAEPAAGQESRALAEPSKEPGVPAAAADSSPSAAGLHQQRRARESPAEGLEASQGQLETSPSPGQQEEQQGSEPSV